MRFLLFGRFNHTRGPFALFGQAPFSVFSSLSRQFFEQLTASPVLLVLRMQFVHVIGHTDQEQYAYLLVTAQQKLSERIVLFDHPEGSFRLDGTVQPQQSTLLTRDPGQRCCALLYEPL